MSETASKSKTEAPAKAAAPKPSAIEKAYPDHDFGEAEAGRAVIRDDGTLLLTLVVPPRA